MKNFEKVDIFAKVEKRKRMALQEKLEILKERIFFYFTVDGEEYKIPCGSIIATNSKNNSNYMYRAFSKEITACKSFNIYRSKIEINYSDKTGSKNFVMCRGESIILYPGDKCRLNIDFDVIDYDKIQNMVADIKDFFKKIKNKLFGGEK